MFGTAHVRPIGRPPNVTPPGATAAARVAGHLRDAVETEHNSHGKAASRLNARAARVGLDPLDAGQ